MVEVFKTDVKCPFVAQQIIADLLAAFVHVQVSFDLDDCDCILRLEFEKPIHNLLENVQEIIQDNGANATPLVSNFEYQNVVYPSVSTSLKLSINAILSIF